MKRFGVFFIALLALLQAGAQTLAGRLDSLVRSAECLQTSEVGITLYNLTRGEQVYAYQDQKLYRPASIEKIITSVTALAELGEGYTFDTRLAYTGEIDGDSVLQGDLYVVGGFDPEFMEADLQALADAVSRAGIRAVSGRLIGDVSLMDSLYWGPGWAWDDTPYAFQPYLSPLMLNRGCVDVRVKPTQKGRQPEVEVVPESDYYRVENRALCQMPQLKSLKVTRNWLDNGNTLLLTGNVGRAGTYTLNLFSSQDFFLRTLAYRLRKQGVELGETAYGICPDEAVGLHTVSRPLREVLLRALKKSDNLSAEALFYHLAIHRNPGEKRIGAEEAQKEITRFMEHQVGKSPDAYSIADGSGVSMYNYVSPDLLLDYLKYAYAHRSLFQSLYDALPIAGVDGTLRHRMKRGKAFRNVRAKTGTVTGVSSLAGYVRGGNGDLFAFVLIHQNILSGKKARDFQDKFCEIVAQ